MIQLEFRGKSVKTDEWITGSAVRRGNFYSIVKDGGEEETIDPYTLSQLVCLKDYSGQHLYVGDIIIVEDNSTHERRPAVIKLDTYGFKARFPSVVCDLSDICHDRIEKIGNFWDNKDELAIRNL